MIKFFRTLRKDLLNNGKTGRYVTYAIGEIILVVIGILLALQINSWNQQRLENQLERQLMASIKAEFEHNLNEINRSIDINKKVTEACLKLTQLIRNDSVGKSAELLDPLLLAIGGINSFDARTGISAEIINSGKLSILKNDEIRSKLGNWLTLLSDCEEDLLFRSDNYTLNLMPFLMKRFPLANGELSKKLEFDTHNYLVTYKEKSPFNLKFSREDAMEFENQIWHHKHNHDYVVINELNVRDFIANTLQLIDIELGHSD